MHDHTAESIHTKQGCTYKQESRMAYGTADEALSQF